jgi:hypothetical protein
MCALTGPLVLRVEKCGHTRIAARYLGRAGHGAASALQWCPRVRARSTDSPQTASGGAANNKSARAISSAGLVQANGLDASMDVAL